MSSVAFRIGTAAAKPGEYAYGTIPVLDLPTGGFEQIPVAVAHGQQPGPVAWVTANIHGPELTGIASIHELLALPLLRELRGTLIVVPSLNPAGLRVMQRAPYYEPGDPNRVWPGGDEPSDADTPTVYEQIAREMYDQIVATEPIWLLDLHNASIDSIPFTIRDRVIYRREEERSRAEELAQRLDTLARAVGLSLVNEVDAKTYVDRKLHRSVAGSMVNVAGIPSLTLELGMGMALDPAAVAAGTKTILNALRHSEMLPGAPEPITEVPVIDLGFAVRRDDQPRAPVSGLTQHLIQPGEQFRAGALLGRMVDLFGRPLDGGELRAQRDGWLIGWTNGLARYRGQTVVSLATRDDEPLIHRAEE